jgi:hypothetical protein
MARWVLRYAGSSNPLYITNTGHATDILRDARVFDGEREASDVGTGHGWVQIGYIPFCLDATVQETPWETGPTAPPPGTKCDHCEEPMPYSSGPALCWSCRQDWVKVKRFERKQCGRS